MTFEENLTRLNDIVGVSLKMTSFLLRKLWNFIKRG